MALEVARRLIDGVWQTIVGDGGDSGGGSSAVLGTSYINLVLVSQSTVAMGSQPTLGWTVSSTMGSDLTLDANTQDVHLVTPGMYQAFLTQFNFSGAFNQYQINLDPDFDVATNSIYRGIEPALGGATEQIVTPPVVTVNTAGVIRAKLYADNAGSVGTFDINVGFLRVVRLA